MCLLLCSGDWQIHSKLIVTDDAATSKEIADTNAANGRPEASRPPICTYSVSHLCKNSRNFGYQGQLENRKNSFETRRGSNFRPFWLESSQFVSRSVEKRGDQSRFKSLGLYINVTRSRYFAPRSTRAMAKHPAGRPEGIAVRLSRCGGRCSGDKRRGSCSVA